MKFQMLGDANKAGPVRLSDVYDSEVGGASTGIAASQKALYDAYNSLNSRLDTYSTDTYSVATYGGTVKCIKLSRVVTIWGWGIGNTKHLAVGDHNLCTVDSKYRPSDGYKCLGVGSGMIDYSGFICYHVQSNGKINMYAYREQGGGGSFSGTYLVPN